jgi:hypothetical protein
MAIAIWFGLNHLSLDIAIDPKGYTTFLVPDWISFPIIMQKILLTTPEQDDNLTHKHDGYTWGNLLWSILTASLCITLSMLDISLKSLSLETKEMEADPVTTSCK